jgi:hypothetical protein
LLTLLSPGFFESVTLAADCCKCGTSAWQMAFILGTTAIVKRLRSVPKPFQRALGMILRPGTADHLIN